jgi:5-formyltetrahydrofolate cyclo-ligase
MRVRRRVLSAEERAAAERAIRKRVLALPAYRQARKIGVYMAFDGEPGLGRLIHTAERTGKRLFAPVVRRHAMVFKPLGKGVRLASNLFGISEPGSGRAIDARSLDLVLTPLVAFDEHGARLGVGRGYYDRCFRFLHHRGGWRKPRLLGIGYELQRVPSIGAEPWDVPLWGAVTEAAVYIFEHGSGDDRASGEKRDRDATHTEPVSGRGQGGPG